MFFMQVTEDLFSVTFFFYIDFRIIPINSLYQSFIYV
nr:MAG TPA: hypothetical protein [Caudoviricetes sp.]